jgi:glycosyltransferase involved in cell wall biosynthesis
MRICMFARSLPENLTGGMEVHTKDLIGGLVNRGHEVSLITHITATNPTGSIEDAGKGLEIYYVGNKSWITKEFYREAGEVFVRLNEIRKFDIVHCQEVAYGYCFSNLSVANIPFIVTIHGAPLTNEIKGLFSSGSTSDLMIGSRKLVRLLITKMPWIYYKVLKRADKIVAVSQTHANEIMQQYYVSAQKLVIIPNGIDTDKFRPMDIRSLRSKLNLLDERIILSAGRIDDRKGFDLLIKILPDILSAYGNVRLVIIGDGPFLPNLKKLAMDIGVESKVIFIGKISHEEMPQYFNLGDVIAFPTYSVESFGLVAAEAMACGRPVVASKSGGLKEIIQDRESGLLAEPRNEEEVRNGIIEILENEKFAMDLGCNARKRILKNFSLDKMINSTIKIYEDLSR